MTIGGLSKREASDFGRRVWVCSFSGICESVAYLMGCVLRPSMEVTLARQHSQERLPSTSSP